MDVLILLTKAFVFVCMFIIYICALFKYNRSTLDVFAVTVVTCLILFCAFTFIGFLFSGGMQASGFPMPIQGSLPLP